MLGDLRPEWRGKLPYGVALAQQRARRAAVLCGEAPEALWLLEHDPPVITVGRREAGGLPDAAALAATGTELYRTERGGLATWHGPGQLVAYLIVDAGRRRLGVRGMFAAVEAAVIDWLQGRGVAQAGRREGYPGVWAGREKVCAVGMHFRRGVSMHGLALNLCPALEGFGMIVPCGIAAGEGGVTSLERLTGERVLPEQVWAEVGAALVGALAQKSG